MCDHMKLFAPASRIGCLLLLVAGLTGCTTIKITEPARTATEQLLLSTAADRALKSADLDIFNGKKVFLDATYFDSYDSKYVLGTVRDALSRAGAILVSSPANCDAIIEARSGALSTDSSTSFFGIPALGVPIPLAGVVSTPEVAIYKSQKQHSTAKIALLAFAGPSGQHLYSSGSLTGKAYNDFYHTFSFTIHSTDLPEEQKKDKNADKYQSWWPDYTPQNFAAPVTNTPAKLLSTNSVTATNSATLPNMNTNSPPATNNISP